MILTQSQCNIVVVAKQRFARPTRTSTACIVRSEFRGINAISLFNAIVQNNWNDEFSGNRTNLKLVGVEHLRYTSASLPAELVEGARNYHGSRFSMPWYIADTSSS